MLRTKTSDRGAWNPWQDGVTLPEVGAPSPPHLSNFRPRPERAHFPRCARIAEQRGRLGGRRARSSCGSGGGGGTAAGREAGAQNTGGAGAQPPFKERTSPHGMKERRGERGRRERRLALRSVPTLTRRRPASGLPRPTNAHVVGRFKTLDFLVRRLKVAPGAAGGQKRAGGGLTEGSGG